MSPLLCTWKAVRRRGIAVGEVLVDEKTERWIVAVESVAETAASLARFASEPAFPMEVLKMSSTGACGEFDHRTRAARGAIRSCTS